MLLPIRFLPLVVVGKFLFLLPQPYYGTFPDFDEMVDSIDVKHRIRIASLGYGLDKLKDDPDPLVRAEVAKLGYYRSQFIQDPSTIVRKAVESWEEE